MQNRNQFFGQKESHQEISNSKLVCHFFVLTIWLLSTSVNKTYTEFIDHINGQIYQTLAPEADWEALVLEAKEASWFTSFAGQSLSLSYLFNWSMIIISQIIIFVPGNCHMLFSVRFLSSLNNKEINQILEGTMANKSIVS